MTVEATRLAEGELVDYTPVGAVVAGQVVCLPDGRAAVSHDAIGAGVKGAVQVCGQFTVAKTTNLVWVDGCKVYWDASANEAILFPASDEDFYLGVAIGDQTAAATTGVVALNVKPVYKIDLHNDEFLTVVVKTVVGSTTVEVPHVEVLGRTSKFVFGATAEAQKLDLLSQQGFSVESDWIIEGGFNIIDDGDASAIDFNIGVASGTHASDADSIAESCFLHMDGNATAINAESDDGTTEVAATDTTKTYALGTPVHFVIDGRNTSDIQIYINGVNVLPSTVFKLNAATGPLKLLAHLEKTSDDTTADYRINYLRARIMDL